MEVKNELFILKVYKLHKYWSFKSFSYKSLFVLKNYNYEYVICNNNNNFVLKLTYISIFISSHNFRKPATK